MPRPRKCRRVNMTPGVTYFKPRGVPLRELVEVYLTVDAFEAIRLADLEGLSHEEAARRMHISRQTFGRILASAHRVVAKALVNGLALRIHGGDYRFAQSGTDEGEDKIDSTEERSGTVPGSSIQEDTMKKIAISSEGPTLDDLVDPRFGRAAGFIVIEPETMAFEYIDNGAGQARAQGAGIQAAETVVSAGAGAVLTGFVGPKAFGALSAAGVRVAQNLENLRVRDAVERFKRGEIIWSTPDQARGFRR